MAAVPERLIILLVDDDGQDAFLIQQALESVHGEVRWLVFSGGEEAIAFLKGEGEYADRRAWPLPNVILLDHWMPRVSGLDVLTWIRNDPRFSSIPVVLLSGGLAPGQLQAGESLGAVFCEKGVSTDELPDALWRAIERAFSARIPSNPLPTPPSEPLA